MKDKLKSYSEKNLGKIEQCHFWLLFGSLPLFPFPQLRK